MVDKKLKDITEKSKTWDAMIDETLATTELSHLAMSRTKAQMFIDSLDDEQDDDDGREILSD